MQTHQNLILVLVFSISFLGDHGYSKETPTVETKDRIEKKVAEILKKANTTEQFNSNLNGYCEVLKRDILKNNIDEFLLITIFQNILTEKHNEGVIHNSGTSNMRKSSMLYLHYCLYFISDDLSPENIKKIFSVLRFYYIYRISDKEWNNTKQDRAFCLSTMQYLYDKIDKVHKGQIKQHATFEKLINNISVPLNGLKTALDQENYRKYAELYNKLMLTHKSILSFSKYCESGALFPLTLFLISYNKNNPSDNLVLNILYRLRDFEKDHKPPLIDIKIDLKTMNDTSQ